VIVEPQDTIAFRRKESIAPHVAFEVFRPEVLAAIDLNNESGLMTHEINDE
jgi:hypothetical protein